MRTRIVKIGNSQAIRIPKPLLDQAGLSGEVDLVLDGDALIVKPARTRRGWEAAFQVVAEEGDDRVLDAPNATRFDEEEWTW